MKQEEQQLSDAQQSAELLKNLKVHSKYVPVDGIPIPSNNGILVKHLPKSHIIENLIELEGGGTTTMYQATANNTQDTCEGIIMSVGPNCTSVPRKGLKIQFLTTVKNQAPIFNHKGKDYIGMDEYSIAFYMVDEATTVDLGVKDPKQLRREDKIPKQQKIIQKMYERDQNEMDVKKDKTKGKIKPVRSKLK